MDGWQDGADVCPLKGMKGEYAVLPERHSQGRLEGAEGGVDVLIVKIGRGWYRRNGTFFRSDFI